MTIQSNIATVSDTLVVSEFIYLLIDELAAGAGPDRKTMEAATRQVLAMKGVTSIVATEGAAPVGVIMLNECAAIYAGGLFGEISELYVSKEHRSKGIAAQLVDAAETYAKEHGWKRLEVGAPPQPNWDRTLQFYLREGFAEVGPRLRKLL
ncbi:Acetyltransferase (GNAT) domain-containing protein [Octadecabacter temperatus]|uniref:Acetyltransferase (GNAT) family protein n=1 Tax=Octadecabacter temperatus TaxID=1458307 RepID=A0A0K0Y2K9_9RHOB|nr:GNAT family N-acetyltransferase [Octadecabacter temperatus]AKS45173.1 Acetyltransferase (GNAT) family protein [Octadecabacter temperatus]SIN87608.1 Acetyltransferase (GNAT) domain-containing protein [Octadecabacter temperatus]